VSALADLTITEPGYGMPLELWVQAVHHGLRIVEVPVPLIYLEEERSFGGSLDDGRKRLEYYHQVMDRAIAGVASSKDVERDLVIDDFSLDASCQLPCIHDA
jgi:dolichol-phosphate mannosyltransferase